MTRAIVVSTEKITSTLSASPVPSLGTYDDVCGCGRRLRQSVPQSGLHTSVISTSEGATPSIVAAISSATSCSRCGSPSKADASTPFIWNVPVNGTTIAIVGDKDGLVLGLALGDVDGDPDGRCVGLALGLDDGSAVGLADGLVDGDELGDAEGLVDGDELGDAEGLVDGDPLGDALGLPDGLCDGRNVGLALGLVDWSEWMNRLPDTRLTPARSGWLCRKSVWRFTIS